MMPAILLLLILFLAQLMEFFGCFAVFVEVELEHATALPLSTEPKANEHQRIRGEAHASPFERVLCLKLYSNTQFGRADPNDLALKPGARTTAKERTHWLRSKEPTMDK